MAQLHALDVQAGATRADIAVKAASTAVITLTTSGEGDGVREGVAVVEGEKEADGVIDDVSEIVLENEDVTVAEAENEAERVSLADSDVDAVMDTVTEGELDNDGETVVDAVTLPEEEKEPDRLPDVVMLAVSLLVDVMVMDADMVRDGDGVFVTLGVVVLEGEGINDAETVGLMVAE